MVFRQWRSPCCWFTLGESRVTKLRLVSDVWNVGRGTTLLAETDGVDSIVNCHAREVPVPVPEELYKCSTHR